MSRHQGKACNQVSKERPPTLFVSILFNVNGNNFPLKALVDIGAEVNVIRKEIIPHDLLKVPETPITLSGADASSLKGGKLGVTGLANLEGRERTEPESTGGRPMSHPLL
jgi:hypothetical protein